jgi:uridine phosphorylase
MGAGDGAPTAHDRPALTRASTAVPWNVLVHDAPHVCCARHRSPGSIGSGLGCAKGEAGRLTTGALAVLAPWPAARPPHAILQLLLGPANAAFPGHLLLGILNPTDELVAGQRGDVLPGVECCPVGHQRLPQIWGKLVHHPTGDSRAAHATTVAAQWKAGSPGDDGIGHTGAMPVDSARRQVVVLAPMPLEMHAIVTAFGLSPTTEAHDSPWTGRLGHSDVTAIHIGMGPPLTREATSQLFDTALADNVPVDHVMVAGICGGLDPAIEVGTLINPAFITDHTSGTSYRHAPPGDFPLVGKLMTTEQVTLDVNFSQRLFGDGFVAVDMESSAVAEVCEARGCAWSVYRCIGDRYFDSLLDQRIVEATNPDGSGNADEIKRLIVAEPDLAAKLERLSRDTTRAAHRAAEAAVQGCLHLDD